tara:strand:+ start:178 stop:471 length:294 start_codon:yes stop_codon:yes gene_type:complete
VLCGQCGQITGVCCVKDAKVCGYGTHSGSSACCKISLTREDAVLCNHYGQVKGSDVCCVDGAKKCPKCNKVLDSPDCCVILVETPDDSETTYEVTPR